MAASTLALVRTGAAGLAALLIFSASVQSQDCAPALPILLSNGDRSFAATGYGVARWHASVNGRRMPYAVHVWKGRTGGKTAYLTFDEVPGTSGPNYHLDTKLKRLPARIDWRARRGFGFDPRLIVRDGQLAGEWTVTNCGMR